MNLKAVTVELELEHQEQVVFGHSEKTEDLGVGREKYPSREGRQDWWRPSAQAIRSKSSPCGYVLKNSPCR